MEVGAWCVWLVEEGRGIGDVTLKEVKVPWSAGMVRILFKRVSLWNESCKVFARWCGYW